MNLDDQIVSQQIGQDNYHHDSCTCILCQKQQQIEQIKNRRASLQMRTIYKNDFVRKPSKINKHKHQLSEMYITPALNAGYLDLNTTYHKDFVNKMGLITKIKPQDNLKNRSNSLQAVTTYMRSYQSTITPKPDDPFKRLQMPVGADSIPFSAESIYQKAYKGDHIPRPNLPFIHKQAMGKPKSIGAFKSTNKISYLTINPQAGERIVKPSGNITSLASFPHNYDTTYRNFYLANQSKPRLRHDLDELGNIYKRSARHYKL